MTARAGEQEVDDARGAPGDLLCGVPVQEQRLRLQTVGCVVGDVVKELARVLLGGDRRPLAAGARGDHAVGGGCRLDDAVDRQRGVEFNRERLGGTECGLGLGEP